MLLNCKKNNMISVLLCDKQATVVLNTCIHSFVSSAREHHEKLDLLHKNMEKQYADLGKYYVFDPRKVSAEEFFGELNNFKNMFLVCFMFIN